MYGTFARLELFQAEGMVEVVCQDDLRIHNYTVAGIAMNSETMNEKQFTFQTDLLLQPFATLLHQG